MDKILKLEIKESSNTFAKLELNLYTRNKKSLDYNKMSIFTSTYFYNFDSIKEAIEIFNLNENEIKNLKIKQSCEFTNFSIEQKIINVDTDNLAISISIVLNNKTFEIGFIHFRYDLFCFYGLRFCYYKDLNDYFSVKLGECINEDLCNGLLSNAMISKMIKK